MEWSIQELARGAGTTSRTLRHYDEIGLLPPARIGSNGYRYYDEDGLVRLQRILVLRGLGLGLPRIAEILGERVVTADALREHIAALETERDRIGRRIGAVRHALDVLEQRQEMTMAGMFDGFDHTEHREEVEARWGAEAYREGDAWWRAKRPEERAAFQEEVERLHRDWAEAIAAGEDPAGERAQSLAARHAAWLDSTPGMPRNARDRRARILGLAAMYVADPRFAANYGGEAGAAFVRDALEHHLR